MRVHSFQADASLSPWWRGDLNSCRWGQARAKRSNARSTVFRTSFDPGAKASLRRSTTSACSLCNRSFGKASPAQRDTSVVALLRNPHVFQQCKRIRMRSKSCDPGSCPRHIRKDFSFTTSAQSVTRFVQGSRDMNAEELDTTVAFKQPPEDYVYLRGPTAARGQTTRGGVAVGKAYQVGDRLELGQHRVDERGRPERLTRRHRHPVALQILTHTFGPAFVHAQKRRRGFCSADLDKGEPTEPGAFFASRVRKHKCAAGFTDVREAHPRCQWDTNGHFQYGCPPLESCSILGLCFGAPTDLDIARFDAHLTTCRARRVHLLLHFLPECHFLQAKQGLQVRLAFCYALRYVPQAPD
mmetsp:Transcript_41076/g.94206  ORF Transcript_41076/g.94206 Transcript_41076/m.94206 type:complete len:355 (+) Transcript_41076:1046-2110(+)